MPNIPVTAQAAPAAIAIGSVVISLADASAYRIEERIEEAPRLGNVIMLNLFVAAVVTFLLGIFAQYLTSRFYLAVALFSLLSVAALDDVLRSRGLVLLRLYILSPRGERMALVTSDARTMRAVSAELDRRRLPRLA